MAVLGGHGRSPGISRGWSKTATWRPYESCLCVSHFSASVEPVRRVPPPATEPVVPILPPRAIICLRIPIRELHITVTFAPTIGQIFFFRIRSNRDSHQIRHWLSTVDEPSTWNIDLRDTSWLGSGWINFFSYDNANITTGDVAHLDNLTVYDNKHPIVPVTSTYYRR